MASCLKSAQVLRCRKTKPGSFEISALDASMEVDPCITSSEVDLTKMGTAVNSREIVVAYVEALNREDFQTARQYDANDVSFDGVLGSRQGADAYFEDMERMRLKYDVKKVFADANDVCILYDVTLSGVRLFACGWYRVEAGKIRTLKVVFDPRPVLAQKAA